MPPTFAFQHNNISYRFTLDQAGQPTVQMKTPDLLGQVDWRRANASLRECARAQLQPLIDKVADHVHGPSVKVQYAYVLTHGEQRAVYVWGSNSQEWGVRVERKIDGVWEPSTDKFAEELLVLCALNLDGITIVPRSEIPVWFTAGQRLW